MYIVLNYGRVKIAVVKGYSRDIRACGHIWEKQLRPYPWCRRNFIYFNRNRSYFHDLLMTSSQDLITDVDIFAWESSRSDLVVDSLFSKVVGIEGELQP